MTVENSRVSDYASLCSRVAGAVTASVRDGTPLSCLLAGIDHLPSIRQTLGEEAGASVLCHVAETLLETTRQSQVVASFKEGRLAVFLPGVACTDAAALACRAGRHLDAKLLAHGQSWVVMTCSFGVADTDGWRRSEGSGRQDLLARAAAALVAAEQAGGNRVVVHGAAARGVRTGPESRGAKVCGTGTPAQRHQRLLPLSQTCDGAVAGCTTGS